ncbi:hypothetical protein FE257_006945 [Aspergillus nanangensis]|uniref:Zn(2)-C6 fungal-type domain-containing protein n=1 Tax=Aspergillus nanangensis TaxID=2582783 RepID=A0AAD4GUN6_ASPNN|nr:hypothetical protein FE257_006945 [Aspergillus nanangensis]
MLTHYNSSQCDRILPICTQCTSTPSRCIYPESGKRGLPQGYITHLEHRLIDTELTLYTLYSHIRSLPTPIPDMCIPQSVTDALARQSRTTNMAEWERLPLREPRDWERWWGQKRVVLGGQTGETRGERGEEVVVDDAEARQLLVDGAAIETPKRTDNKAERLARSEASVYF